MHSLNISRPGQEVELQAQEHFQKVIGGNQELASMELRWLKDWSTIEACTMIDGLVTVEKH